MESMDIRILDKGNKMAVRMEVIGETTGMDVMNGFSAVVAHFLHVITQTANTTTAKVALAKVFTHALRTLMEADKGQRKTVDRPTMPTDLTDLFDGLDLSGLL